MPDRREERRKAGGFSYFLHPHHQGFQLLHKLTRDLGRRHAAPELELLEPAEDLRRHGPCRFGDAEARKLGLDFLRGQSGAGDVQLVAEVDAEGSVRLSEAFFDFSLFELGTSRARSFAEGAMSLGTTSLNDVLLGPRAHAAQ